MPVRSPYADVEIPDVPLFDFLFTDFGERAGAPAFVDGPSGAAITFAELEGMVLKIAAALSERGIGAGDVVALFAPNTPSYAAVFHGILRANAIVTSVNSLYTPGELAHQLGDSGAKLVFTVSPFLDRVTAALAEVGLPADAVVVLDAAEGRTSLRDLLATTAEPPAQTVTAGDTAVLPYSSGTTGRAKGVILTHRNLVANLCQIAEMGDVSSETKILAVLPFFHIYGMTVMMNQGLHRRATVVTMPKFDLPEFLRVISEHRVSRVYIAPPVAVALAKHPIVDQYDLSCIDVVFSGAAPLDAELGQAVAKRLNCTVLQGYGMTELSPVSHCMPDDRPDMDLNTCGFAIPNVESKLVDPETGQEVGPGERGELWVRGPNVMSGYLNNPEATAITLDDEGYLHTGDVATVTEDGVFTIVDRVKELIKYKGYQVPPAELEALLLTHDEIADAAVIGVRDADGEEVPKAFVVRQAGANLGAAEVMAFVAERIAPHKKVRVVEFIDEIPKSASGKILRKDLRAREAERV
ncbi:4-coumarate--CoA ligase family protein [Pseudonocardia kunmingensis]|uniref:Acyl-CoA synthetase (AMP-forming)/AMP-acid ligase II n=1 Tax=Pseudonocardia kunmingensis TaxID=630975 RepID=A0A543E2E7_9PSEU|nr:4-coumarate--CoA ligase family protein [Pseudonocardia kunmingensis]TQM15629.1 acyl-CoA synthetase (AMP-forming)/AMP-acid ligase II [Pseudonocardia kunmingensis]